MKQQISIFLNPFNLKIYRIFFFWLLLILSVGAILLFPSFSNPKLAASSLILPFSKSSTFKPTAISCQINNTYFNDFRATEANLFIMEQSENIFAKVLNMSLEDGDGNLFALSLTDLEKAEMDSCLTINSFYGMEHKKSDQNFSQDIGTTVFSNNSSLIFEKKDGDSTISRNGWIKINRCEKGMISGNFYFIMEGEKSNKSIEGEFVNVLISME